MGALARPSDPETSHEAAESLDAEHIRKSQTAVLAVLGYLGQSTDARLVKTYIELAELGQVPQQSPSGIRTRRKELTRLGRVLDTGHRSIAPSGRRSIVWSVAAR